MAPRKAVTEVLIFGVFCLIITILYLPNLSRHIIAPVILSGATLVLGAVIWVTLRSMELNKTLKTIGHQENKISFADFQLTRAIALTFAIIAVIAGVILLAFYIAYYQPFWSFLINIVVPFPIAYSFTSATILWRWQHRNNQTLYVVNNKLSLTPT